MVKRRRNMIKKKVTTVTNCWKKKSMQKERMLTGQLIKFMSVGQLERYKNDGFPYGANRVTHKYMISFISIRKRGLPGKIPLHDPLGLINVEIMIYWKECGYYYTRTKDGKISEIKLNGWLTGIVTGYSKHPDNPSKMSYICIFDKLKTPTNLLTAHSVDISLDREVYINLERDGDDYHVLGKIF